MDRNDEIEEIHRSRYPGRSRAETLRSTVFVMAFVAMTTPIILPWPLQSSLEAAARALLEPSDGSHIDFSRPTGEAALVSPD